MHGSHRPPSIPTHCMAEAASRPALLSFDDMATSAPRSRSRQAALPASPEIIPIPQHRATRPPFLMYKVSNQDPMAALQPVPRAARHILQNPKRLLHFRKLSSQTTSCRLFGSASFALFPPTLIWSALATFTLDGHTAPHDTASDLQACASASRSSLATASGLLRVSLYVL